jgi:dolichol-phosphate mannosyltransferase
MEVEYDLSVVIPVFNEEKNISGLLKDWLVVFQSIPVRARFIVINDGSTDGTAAILQSMAGKIPDMIIDTRQNAGHGPSILAGYKTAIDAPWVFQVDSDHQQDPGTFAELWNRRDEFDFLLGERKEKNATVPRRGISFFSRIMVRLLFGKGVRDVNSPYRLMRSSRLKEALRLIPGRSFAPNILITSWFVFSKTRIFTVETENRNERIIRLSRMNPYFLKGAFQSMFQTILFRFRL